MIHPCLNSPWQSLGFDSVSKTSSPRADGPSSDFRNPLGHSNPIVWGHVVEPARKQWSLGLIRFPMLNGETLGHC